jgi:hypothetical protein
MIKRVVSGPRRIAVAIRVGEACVSDPAVNLASSDLSKYQESLYDISHLKFYDGQTPTFFTIQPLSRKQKDIIGGVEDFRKKANLAARMSVLSIENYEIERDGGVTVRDPQPDRQQSGDLGSMASESWLDTLDLPADFLAGLYWHIYRLSEAQGPLSKN